MAAIDPAHRLTSTYTIDDLAEFAAGAGPHLSIVVPSPSEHADAGERFDIRWGNARRRVEDRWDADLLTELDAVGADLSHDLGDAVAVFQRADGESLVEHLAHGVTATSAIVMSVPRLSVVLENRQRTLPHIVVDTDRAGATILGFDAGSVVAEQTVEGETEHIHRGHPGGYSQRRFQQRAENTWEGNADDVAAAVLSMADTLDPIVTVVAGEVRARHLVCDALDDPRVGRLESLDVGSAEGIATETLRILDDEHARLLRSILDGLRSGDHLSDADEIMTALGEGRVDTLLVHDADDADPDRVELVNRAIVAAMSSGARITVAPRVAELADGLAAALRW